MSHSPWRGDLVVLVPDKNMESAVSALLDRRGSLRIPQLQYTIYIHMERDPGCLLRGHDFLRPFATDFAHALIVLDHEGSGRDHLPPNVLEDQITSRLSAAGWDNRAAAVVVKPELEIWVWSDSPHVARSLGWRSNTDNLRKWLEEEGYWRRGQAKPRRPKATMEHVLRTVRRPRSSAIYGELARRVGLNRCTDGSFQRLRGILQGWFSPDL
jgi:hypothetical protein